MPYTTDPAMREMDSQPPTLNTLSVSMQAESGSPKGCGGESSCGYAGSIRIGPAATDDVTASQDIGYRVTATDTRVPLGLSALGAIGSPQLYPVIDGKLVLYYVDAGDQPFDFVVSIVAIDRAGNESAERFVRVKSDDGGGCSVALGSRLPTAVVVVTFALLAAATTLTRRRFRARV